MIHLSNLTDEERAALSSRVPPWPNQEWTPMIGCTQVSAGCRRCRAQIVFQEFGELQVFPERLADPTHWPDEPQRSVAVAMSSDLFHEQASPILTRSVLAMIEAHPRHLFWVLTKRPERFREFEPDFPNGIPNLYLGVSCENQDALDERLPLLLRTTLTDAKVLAAKPLLVVPF